MRSIRARVVLAALVAVLLGGIIALLVTDRAYRDVLESTTSQSLVAAERGFETLRQSRIDMMHAALLSTLDCTEIRHAFIDRDREKLQELSWERFQRLQSEFGISRWYYYEPDGTVFLRVYTGAEALDPSLYGDSSRSRSLAEARRTGRTVTGVELGREALSVRVSMPMRGDHGEVVGFVTMGERVDDYLETIAGRTGGEYALFLNKSWLDHGAWRELRARQGQRDDWDDFEDAVFAESTPLLGGVDPKLLYGDSPMAIRSQGLLTHEGRSYSRGIFQLIDTVGEPVAFVVVFEDVTSLTEAFKSAQLGLILSFLVIGLTISVTMTLFLEKTVFARIDGMVSDMERMSMAVVAGTYDGTSRIGDVPDDEIGRFERFFESFLGLVASALHARDREGER